MSPLKLTTSLIPQPASYTVKYIDSSPDIQSKYGEKVFYYRIDCTDNHDNTSDLSSAASGYVSDITPPDIPQDVTAEGHMQYIRISWKLNSEPDIESYAIYRSLCHRGQWLTPPEQKEMGIDCGPFVLLAEVSHEDARELAEVHGKPFFDDYTVPLGSPLCYAYWVKARDKSQNLSGDWPVPNSVDELPLVVCQRLRDETPPPPPIPTTVQARDNAVFLEWIAAPSQDLAVFHVYRSEQESADYKWIGGITVEEPPTPPAEITEPFRPSAPVGCDKIPLVPHEGMNSGTFIDKTPNPKKIYWYKITSVDQNGNENKLDKSVPYSTFTFKSSGPPQPSIVLIKKSTSECGLEISWTPTFDRDHHLGFVVFRSSTEPGIYRQISPIVQGNFYLDATVNENVTYWYKVLAFDKDGRPSKLSMPQKGAY